MNNLNRDKISDDIVAVLQNVYDPEIPVNIYDLGLIYHIRLDNSGNVEIVMTLPSPLCPVAGSSPGLVKSSVERVKGVKKVKVELVWDPPWDAGKMKDKARLELGWL